MAFLGYIFCSQSRQQSRWKQICRFFHPLILQFFWLEWHWCRWFCVLKLLQLLRLLHTIIIVTITFRSNRWWAFLMSEWNRLPRSNRHLFSFFCSFFQNRNLQKKRFYCSIFQILSRTNFLKRHFIWHLFCSLQWLSRIWYIDRFLRCIIYFWNERRSNAPLNHHFCSPKKLVIEKCSAHFWKISSG